MSSVALPPREVAQTLGLRRFLQLCTIFDGRKREKEGKETASLGAFGYLGNFRTEGKIKARTQLARFDVLKIFKVDGKLHVHCEDEWGKMYDVEVN